MNKSRKATITTLLVVTLAAGSVAGCTNGFGGFGNHGYRHGGPAGATPTPVGPGPGGTPGPGPGPAPTGVGPAGAPASGPGPAGPAGAPGAS